ncbi:MAG: TSUP family transporter [Solirubrobacterales bacterium]|nr:TSUP family transporter [Solirubrobacterales bacterium]
MIELAAAVALGFAGGVVGGMLGVGGGILFVPALVVVLDEPQIRAEATSLVAIVPVAIVGAWLQNRRGNVRVRDGLLIGALSPAGVLAGVVLSNMVSQRTLEVAFAILILAVAAQLTRRALEHP